MKINRKDKVANIEEELRMNIEVETRTETNDINRFVLKWDYYY